MKIVTHDLLSLANGLARICVFTLAIFAGPSWAATTCIINSTNFGLNAEQMGGDGETIQNWYIIVNDVRVKANYSGGAYRAAIGGKNYYVGNYASGFSVPYKWATGWAGAYGYQVCGNFNSAPVAGAVTMSVVEDTERTVGLLGSDADGDLLTYSIVSGPATGVATISGSQLKYTPAANWNGTTTLTYRATDPQGEVSNTATVTITVNAVNDAPSANPVTLNTSEDTPGSATLSGSDVDIPYGDSLSYEVVGQPGQGTASISGSTVNYTPPPNWSGTTSMTYRAKDLSLAYSTVVTITINVAAVNDAPVAQAKAITTDEDTSGAVTLAASDIDSPVPSIFQIVTAPAQGTASVSGSVLTYTPPGNWSGSTSLTYRAQDSGGAWSAPVTVSITVNPINDVPVVQAKSITAAEDSSGSVTLTVTDPDIPYGDSHTFEIVSGPNASHGSASISGSTLTFTPAANWSGTTSLTYRVRDAASAFSNTATVTITVNPVNDAPVAQAKTMVTDEDTADTVTLTATDIDSPTPTVFQVVSDPAQGTATISGNALTYTPPANWSGTTSLTYRAQDSGGAWSAPVTVSITVNPINDVPVVQAKSITAAEDGSGSVTLTVTDPDIAYGDSHTFEIVSAPNAAHGTASISGSTLTFTPVANWNGSTSLSYRAKDEAGAYSAPATVTITITAVNDSPVSAAKSASTNEDVAASISLSATDIDSPVPTVFQVVAAPNASYGVVSISGGTATFTPAANWNGVATFTYRAQDSLGAWSAPSTVTVTVAAVNDTPVPSSVIDIQAIEGKSATVKFIVNP